MPDETREPLTNVGALNTAIQDAFQKRLGIETQIDVLMALHITPLQKARTRLMRELKADTTIADIDLGAFFKLWKRQEEAKDFEDEGQRDTVLDNMRTLFNALSVGEMLDFVTVLRIGEADLQPAHLRVVDDARDAAAAEDEVATAETQIVP